jgi:hypothetical protein
MFNLKRSGWLRETQTMIQLLYLISSNCWKELRSSRINLDLIFQMVKTQQVIYFIFLKDELRLDFFGD